MATWEDVRTPGYPFAAAATAKDHQHASTLSCLVFPLFFLSFLFSLLIPIIRNNARLLPSVSFLSYPCPVYFVLACHDLFCSQPIFPISLIAAIPMIYTLPTFFTPRPLIPPYNLFQVSGIRTTY